jgi:transcriptional regulator with XRE-family HTH domain
VEYILWRKVRLARRLTRMTGEARKLISRNLRKLRTVHGMTQEDLAAAAEVDRSYISEIENERFSASADLVEKLAGVFGIEIYEMFHPDTAENARPRGKK